MMIETRESYQRLLKPKRRRKKQTEVVSYGTLKGEALLHADDSASSKQINGVVAHENGGISATPQSVEPRQYAEYQQPLRKIPVQQSTNGISPLSTTGLPPAIPLRRRADSSGDRSVGELSTVSGVSGHSRQRSSWDGHDFFGPGNSLSPTYAGSSANYAIPPQPPRQRRSRSPKPRPPRSGSPTLNAAPFMANGNTGNQGNMLLAGYPLHQRRPSDEHSYSNRHRRAYSYDVPREKLRRGSSFNSLYSLNSQGSMNSETLKLLPDPRWGGGSGGSRARSFSGGSGKYANISYSTDSVEGKQQQFGYGSVTGSSAKEVIMNGNMIGRTELNRGHRRNNSEVSTSTYASAASIDRSVEPVMTDMRKSSMFKGVTNKGVVKLQLPKDNFRLLSDRDLESGRVYKRALVDNEDDYFQDYHITTDDDVESPPFLPSTSDCQCPCTSCENCHGRRKQLPPSYYVMAVDSDIYQRMFDEVEESMNMPCKLFYCGHHEDVDYPSIGIAVVGVVIIFLVMLWATIYVDG